MRGNKVARTWKWNPTLYAPPKYRRACRYDAFIPTPLAGAAFDLSAETSAVVSDAEQAILTLNASAVPALAPLARLLLRTESIASSRIEGLQLDAGQLARAETRAETGGRISPTAVEILGNIDAMQLAIEDAASTAIMGTDQIAAIHRALMQRSPLERIAGVVRTEQNWIGGNDYNPCRADFVPPPPEHVAPLLDDLADAIAADALPPIVQAAVVHAQFETIHPFADGNGRTGRALIHVVLRRRELAATYVPPISILLAADRDGYIRGLEDFRHDRVDAWIRRFATAAAGSSKLAKAYLGAVEDLQERWRAMLSDRSNPRADAAAWAVIDVLPAHPVITSPVAVAATGRAKAAIHQGIGQLEEAAVLEPLSQAKRNRAWEAVGLLDLLERLDAGKPPE